MSTRHILVFRLSAMGDVALTLPVIRGVLEEHPDIQITILTRDFFAPFFSSIDRLRVISPQLETRHKGLPGLFRLFADLKKNGKYDVVIDLHAVLRTYILSTLFRFGGTKRFGIKKDRQIKNSFLSKKEAPYLPHILERYIQVFKHAGIEGSLKEPPCFNISHETNRKVNTFVTKNHLVNRTLIGIAPYAKHELKIWPQKHVYDLINRVRNLKNVEILLFGGGKVEMRKLKEMASEFSECHIVDLNLSQQIALIARLSVMLTMDSANMHLAALSGIPVVSVWGATHPGMGFYAWKQKPQNTIQIDTNELNCRPCTVFGKGTCHRGDFACMESIGHEKVLKRIENILVK